MKNYSLEVSPRNYIEAIITFSDCKSFIENLENNYKIDISVLQDPSLKVPFKEIDRSISRIQSEYSYTAKIPIQIGSLTTLTRDCLLFRDNWHQVSIDSMFQSIAIYYKLLMPALNFEYFTGEDNVTLSIKPIEASSKEALHFHFGYVCSAIYSSIMRILDSNIPYIIISLPKVLQSQEEHYKTLERADIEFVEANNPELRINFPKRSPHYDPSYVKPPNDSKTQMQSIVEAITAEKNLFSAWVSLMLRESNGQISTMTDIAATLNLSVRTLGRYLEKEGVMFRDITQNVMNDRAKSLLKDGYKVSMIADQLGYSCTGTFTRSFRKLNGMKPTEYRETLLSKGPNFQLLQVDRKEVEGNLNVA